MSFISFHTKEYVQINIPIEEVRKMLKKDEEALNEFAICLDKYVTWIEDVKRINTKRLLQGAGDWIQPS